MKTDRIPKRIFKLKAVDLRDPRRRKKIRRNKYTWRIWEYTIKPNPA